MIPFTRVGASIAILVAIQPPCDVPSAKASSMPSASMT